MRSLRCQLPTTVLLAFAMQWHGAHSKTLSNVSQTPVPAQKEITFTYTEPRSRSRKIPRLQIHPETHDHPMIIPSRDVFLQRSAARQAVRQRRKAPGSDMPRSAEDMDTILGVPKIVWVILADIVTLAAFLLCIPLMMYISKEHEEEDEEDEGDGNPKTWDCRDPETWDCPCAEEAQARPGHGLKA